ncbi:MAG: cob(I)yrinic acid a,c-diamide adenosyltransferase [Chlorobi bacterium]|nr:cob(I)yrinic acid a,c-diamide adenosyltransferase [Chlorobiota bacterium]
MSLRIYTKTGDRGTTALFGGGRVPKYDVRIETYGTIDELNSTIGVVIAHEQTPQEIRIVLMELSAFLLVLGSDLATPDQQSSRMVVPRIEPKHVTWLEEWIDRWDESLPPLKNFILPTGSMPSALLHVARTICRRAERRAVELAEREHIGEAIIPFLNRCSDFLFVAARKTNALLGSEDVLWRTPHAQ